MKESKLTRKMRLINKLMELGFHFGEACALRRIERTLHRWHEAEFNGEIQRDGEDGEGAPRRCFTQHNWGLARETVTHRVIIADRERGAEKRLAAIIEARNARGWHKSKQVVPYIQGDPCGCALYLLTREQVGENRIDEVYNRGVAVCE